MFLGILRSSQENTCARVSFLIKLQASSKKESLAEGFSSKFCKILKKLFFREHLWRTASLPGGTGDHWKWVLVHSISLIIYTKLRRYYFINNNTNSVVKLWAFLFNVNTWLVQSSTDLPEPSYVHMLLNICAYEANAFILQKP